jgi:hypothetical protein
VELRDLIVTPLLIILVYMVAYTMRSRVTDGVTRQYYFLALTAKIAGALALGFVYQFYYSGGDTFTYHTHGSRHIWEAFIDSPETGFKLFFSGGKLSPGLYDYFEKIWYLKDSRAFFIIQVATIFDFITFSSYSGTATLFAVISFIGGWSFYRTFYNVYPQYHRWLAICCLFIPSVVFWGSGLMKDTITMAAIGVLTFQIQQVFIFRKVSFGRILVIILVIYTIFVVRKFILQAYLPAATLWVTAYYYHTIQSVVARMVVLPGMILIILIASLFLATKVGEGDQRYALDRIAQTSQTTAYDIRYWTGKDAGSGYTLGELDGTMLGMLKLAPQAVNVSIFRPYPWEVNNVLMAFSAMESFAMLLVSLFLVFRYFRNVASNWSNPEILFCLTFCIIFGFAVGVSTFNFGSLVRYRIAILPMYAVALVLLTGLTRTQVAAKAANKDLFGQ